MTPTRPKLRQIAKRAALALAVLIAAPSIASFAFGIGGINSTTGAQYGIGRGTLAFMWPCFDWPDEWSFVTAGQMRSFGWWLHASAYGDGLTWVQILIWLIALLLLAPTAWLWLRDRHDKGPGHCVACGYNLTGVPAAAVCPECGKIHRT